MFRPEYYYGRFVGSRSCHIWDLKNWSISNFDFQKETKNLFTSLNKFWAVWTFILLMACVLFIIREIMIVKRHVLERRSNSLHWPWKTAYHTCGIINASLGRTRALACSINLTSRHVPPSSVEESVKRISS